MLTRRELLNRGLWAGAAAVLLPGGCARTAKGPGGVWVNDIHSGLNRTLVARVQKPTNVEGLQTAIRSASREGRSISITGGRHAMGGQQFGTGTALIDVSGVRGILAFDGDVGHLEVGGGTQWPELITGLLESQKGLPRQWGIVQKQTGADRLSIAGTLAANAHGRGLTYRPIVQDVEAFTLVDARGELHRCSRSENEELFRLAIGGYGLFGVIASVRLRLAPRQKIERVVEVTDISDISGRFEERIEQGYLFGDFQYSTDVTADSGLRQGVFSCYRPVGSDTLVPEHQHGLSRENWLELLRLAHVDRGEAFRLYSSYYLGTHGQIYWSDTHQLSTYIDDYHHALGSRIAAYQDGNEMITEIYVPRDVLEPFMEDVRRDFVEHDVPLIYGTVRLIERDDECFLTWARESWACVIFNLHTAHDASSVRATASHFRRLIERARAYGGSYFLTYHRWASKEQVLACHPQLPEFLALKRKYDPGERFQSDWYRHYREMFGT